MMQFEARRSHVAWPENIVDAAFRLLAEFHVTAWSELGECTRRSSIAHINPYLQASLQRSSLWKPAPMDVEPEFRPDGTLSDIDVYLDALTSHDAVRMTVTFVNNDEKTMTLGGAIWIIP